MLIRETHRIQTRPGMCGFLAGLLVMLLALVANASCSAPMTPKKPEVVEPTRTPVQRAEAAVAVYTNCGTGTGVLIDGHTVLTAFHVINCGDGDAIELASFVVVRTHDKIAFTVKSLAGDPGRDLARLDLNDEATDVVPVKIRMARADEIVCAVTAIPERGFKCGVVASLGGYRAHGDVQVRNANYWYGNSGSGVYSQDGQLIGIAVRLGWCSAGDAFLVSYLDMRVDTCVGRVTSITDSLVLS